MRGAQSVLMIGNKYFSSLEREVQTIGWSGNWAKIAFVNLECTLELVGRFYKLLMPWRHP